MECPDLSSRIVSARTAGGIPPRTYQVTQTSIGSLLSAQATAYGGKEWLIYYPEGDSSAGSRLSYTYADFYRLVCRAANCLRAEGIGRGDRIATVSFNHADVVIQYFAAFLIGAVVVPVNLGEDDRRIGYILNNSQAKLAFVRAPFVPRLDRILAELSAPITVVPVGTADGAGDHGREFHERLRDHPDRLGPGEEPGLEDEALIVYTSGTTGLPKGVVLTQYNLLIDAKAIAEWHGMTPEQRMMCVLPLHHVNGTIVTLMTPLSYGGSVVLNQKFHSSTFFERIARERVHVVSVVPTLLQFLLHEETDLSGLDLSHFRHIICGAGPLTVELAMNFEARFGIPIIHGYGLSETTCYSCFLPLGLSAAEHRRWLNDYGFPSIGVPISPNEMAIHDPSGAALPEAARGEIVIRGHNVMKGYYGDVQANEHAFAHGWFRSGDEGFFRTDSAGRQFFFITGRLKELIIRGGANISPFEIDEVLMNMPGVRAGLAVGFDNDWYGEEIGAYVQVKDGVTLSEREVIAYCRNVFPFQKCPKVVLFGSEIPVTSTGKYQRNRLKPLFAPWKGVQFTEDANSR
jgi:long-chain acyl-CoA synthetase